MALEQRGDWPGVLALAERWTQAVPGDAGAWSTLGIAYDQLQRPQEAVLAYQRALALPQAGPMPPYMAYMGLANDLHALGRQRDLQSLYADLAQSRPDYAAMLAAQYPELASAAPTAPGGGPVPSGLPAMARRHLAVAKQQRPDAVLTRVDAENLAGKYQVSFTFYSPAAGEAMTSVEGTPGASGFAPSIGDSPRPLPLDFVDLPQALSAARDIGMAEPFAHAVLEVQVFREKVAGPDPRQKGPISSRYHLVYETFTGWEITPLDAGGGAFYVDPKTGAASTQPLLRNPEQ